MRDLRIDQSIAPKGVVEAPRTLVNRDDPRTQTAYVRRVIAEVDRGHVVRVFPLDFVLELAADDWSHEAISKAIGWGQTKVSAEIRRNKRRVEELRGVMA